MFLVKSIWTLLVIIYAYWRYDSWIGSPFYTGYLGISRLFEFSLGMAAAKIFFEDHEKLIKYLTSLKIIGLAAICEVIGTIITFFKIDAFNHRLPIGLAICDALIGFGIFVIVFNLSRLIIKINPKVSKVILLISKFSYEMYLCQFIALLLITYLLKFLNPVYPGLIMLLTIPTYSLAVGIDILASFLVQKITLFLTSRLSGSPRAPV
jgi:peptidoglycan/LPS O-acetylase OafA/YrhL